MYIERDAKILLIYYSIVGIVIFIALYLGILYNQQRSPNDSFAVIQIMIFSIITILTIILAGSSYSLKKEISNQQQYLQKLQQTAGKEQIVKIPYNKGGLYSIILVSAIGIIAFLYLYNMMVLEPPTGVSFQKGALETVSMIIFIIILILATILLITLKVLMKRIQTPLYYEYKPCPRCGSSDIHKVEYSWWGGLVGPALVHQVRCKKCGKAYDGSTGKDITRRLSIYLIIVIAILLILIILRYIF